MSTSDDQVDRILLTLSFFPCILAGVPSVSKFLLASGISPVCIPPTVKTSILLEVCIIRHSEASAFSIKDLHAAGTSLNEKFANLCRGTFLKVILAFMIWKLFSVNSCYLLFKCVSAAFSSSENIHSQIIVIIQIL